MGFHVPSDFADFNLFNPFHYSSESINRHNAQSKRRKRMVTPRNLSKVNSKNYTAAFDGLRDSVKFTLASSKDRFPTVTAGRLGIPARKNLNKIKVILASKKTLASGAGTTYEVEFRLNRFVTSSNATFIATNWPKGLRKPKVGQPYEFAVLSIESA